MATIAWATDVGGNFSTATNWKGDVVPGTSDEAFLAGDGGAAYTVTVTSADVQVGSLRISPNATLFLDNTNDGAGGIVDYLSTNLAANGAIDNMGYEIDASGTIKGYLNDNPWGIVDAGYATALTIDTKTTVVNHGILEASGSGGLIIESTTVDDDGGGDIGGSITSNAKVVFEGAHVQGGELSGNIIQIRGPGNVLDGATETLRSNAPVRVMSGASLTGEGQIDNDLGGRFVVKGSATFTGATENAGILETAGAGVLTMQGAVSAIGYAESEALIDGGTMTFDSTVQAKVVFEGSGMLVLGDAEGFSGSLQNFATNGSTTLYLEDVGFAGAGEATYSGINKAGVLTVVGANQTVQFTLEGDYQGVTFTVTSADGGSASVITASATADVVQFAQTMASFGPSSGAIVTAQPASDLGHEHPLVLAVPMAGRL